MKPRVLRFGIPLIIAAGCGLAIFWSEAPTQGQVVPAKAAAEARSKPLSALNCIGCHSGPDSEAYKAYAKEGRTDFIRLDEYRLWHEQDLHSRAFVNIVPNEKGLDGKTNLAWKMQEVLCLDKKRHDPAKDKHYRVDKAAECLACHATAVADEKPPRFHTANGVSCEACHGSVDSKWLGEHLDPSWRDKPPTDKRTQYGQIDLRDPQTRAERCASCHIGNKDEGKFVTHEMYAAGHPSLPAFEMAAYCRDQPAHYKPANLIPELKNWPADKNREAAWKNFHYRPEELAEVRHLALGSVAAFRSSMKLLADETEKLPSGELLDFAHFDCAACHHDLKYPSDRQNRNQGIPGRPLMKAQTELLQTVLDHAGQQQPTLKKMHEEMAEEMAQLRNSFDKRPFGEPADVSALAKKLVVRSDELLREMQSIVYTPEATKALSDAFAQRLRKLEAKDKNGKPASYLDRDSAQQLLWAWLAVRRERHGDKDSEALKQLGKILPLSVREKENGLYPLKSVEDRLKNRGDIESNYNSEAFLEAMDGLLKGMK